MNYRSIITGAYISRILITIMGIGFQVFISYKLNVMEIAEFAKLFSFSNVIVTLFSLGLGNGVIFFIKKNGDDFDTVNDTLFTFLLYVLFPLNLVWIGIGIYHHFSAELIILCICQAVFSIIINFLTPALTTKSMYRSIYIGSVLGNLVQIVLAILFSILAVVDLELVILCVISNVITNAIYLILSNLKHLRIRFHRFDRSLFKAMLFFGIKVMISNLLILFSLDYVYLLSPFLLPKLIANSYIAILNRGMIFVNIGLMFLQVVSQPVLARWSNRSVGTIREDFAMLFSAILYFSIFVCSVFQFSDLIIQFGLGFNYIDSINFIKNIIFVLPFILLCNLGIFLHLSQGKVTNLIGIYMFVMFVIIIIFFLSNEFLSTLRIIEFYIFSHFCLAIFVIYSSKRLINFKWKEILHSPQDVYLYFRNFLYPSDK